MVLKLFTSSYWQNHCSALNLTNTMSKMFMSLFTKIFIFRLKIIVDTDWCQQWNITTQFLKIRYKIKTQACFLMQRFQSFSGHSSEQSIFLYSSWPTVSYPISNGFANHQSQGTQISPITNTPFIQNLNPVASNVEYNCKFSVRNFQLLQ